MKVPKDAPRIAVRRRHVLLLEVLIAFALIAFCALPLLSTHIHLLQIQKKFVTTVELDHLVNLLYVDVLERLHANEIPWDSIVDKREFVVDEALLQRIGQNKKLAFKGSYQFGGMQHKNKDAFGVYLVPLTFTFLANDAAGYKIENSKQKKPYLYCYQIFIARDIK